MEKPKVYHETVCDYVDGKKAVVICDVLVDENHEYVMVDGKPQFVEGSRTVPVHIGPCAGMPIAHEKWVRDAAKEWRRKQNRKSQ